MQLRWYIIKCSSSLLIILKIDKTVTKQLRRFLFSNLNLQFAEICDIYKHKRQVEYELDDFPNFRSGLCIAKIVESVSSLGVLTMRQKRLMDLNV